MDRVTSTLLLLVVLLSVVAPMLNVVNGQLSEPVFVETPEFPLITADNRYVYALYGSTLLKYDIVTGAIQTIQLSESYSDILYAGGKLYLPRYGEDDYTLMLDVYDTSGNIVKNINVSDYIASSSEYVDESNTVTYWVGVVKGGNMVVLTIGDYIVIVDGPTSAIKKIKYWDDANNQLYIYDVIFNGTNYVVLGRDYSNNVVVATYDRNFENIMQVKVLEGFDYPSFITTLGDMYIIEALKEDNNIWYDVLVILDSDLNIVKTYALRGFDILDFAVTSNNEIVVFGILRKLANTVETLSPPPLSSWSQGPVIVVEANVMLSSNYFSVLYINPCSDEYHIYQGKEIPDDYQHNYGRLAYIGNAIAVSYGFVDSDRNEHRGFLLFPATPSFQGNEYLTPAELDGVTYAIDVTPYGTMGSVCGATTTSITRSASASRLGGDATPLLQSLVLVVAVEVLPLIAVWRRIRK